MVATARKTSIFIKWATVGLLLVGCSNNASNKTSYRFNRIVSPIPTRNLVDAKYQKQAEELNSRYYYVLGQYLMRKKDIKGALQALERARAFNESEPEIYYSLSGIYAQLGKVEEAEALLRRTLELDSNHFAALLDLAQLIKGSGSMDEVHELFKRASKVDPNSDEAVLGLVVIDMASKNYKKARKVLSEFLSRRKDSHLAHFYMGTLEQDVGNFAQAEKHYKKALELRPDFSRAAAYLGQIYENQNRNDELLKLYEDSSQYVQGVSFLKRIGEIRSQRKEFALALSAFESYLEVDQDNTEVMLRVAFLSLEAKDYATSEKYFKKIVALKPDFSSAHYFIGILLEDKKDFKAALASLAKVKPGTTVSVDALRAMVRIYGETKDYDAGLKVLVKALDQMGAEAPAGDREKLTVEMVTFLAKAKRYDEALSFADRGIKALPESEELRYARSVTMEEAGNALQGAKDLQYLIEQKKTTNPAILNFVGYVFADNDLHLEKAESYVRLARKLRPEDPYIADSLGWVLFKRGEYRASETWLRKALEGAPGEVVVLEHLGDCLVKLGALQEATDLYAKAIAKGHKNELDQKRLRAKHDGLHEKLQVLCSKNSDDAACRIVRDPRSPAATASANP